VPVILVVVHATPL